VGSELKQGVTEPLVELCIVNQAAIYIPVEISVLFIELSVQGFCRTFESRHLGKNTPATVEKVFTGFRSVALGFKLGERTLSVTESEEEVNRFVGLGFRGTEQAVSI